ncbi:UDP-N-acetylglucosamine 2-epimerase (non-hydrolyzing) [Pseudovibrio sp. Tun.PSC04-5.I4]|uniref:non-hydrolyzing UDP-N-acetylglucosamine 2-epimerase n=1 Tax=Pseudovibrio sp. Tun.PSC04-5.I4 TaxID=1798213 RepID=UPI000888C5E0|nr:UDP-N-acetylglucosamine 2-epimerase (non-hydrolyzing) [Pseudovibrio sp. Tun.PSC04-5.I4]SDR03164.1 UDP-N-acetylglucosamine 2-epimerase (non-hydrolysing) [Pseudovibrio sp. Tun.PSC04-5.I4]
MREPEIIGNGPHKVLCIIGTRPEAIKMAPVISAISKCKSLHAHVLMTGQHKEIASNALISFDIHKINWLDIIASSHHLADQASDLLKGINAYIAVHQPQYVLVHGDTTTGFVGALASFYSSVSVGHVEAGLRSGDLYDPFPEEANRRLADQLCHRLFAPTSIAQDNLLREGIAYDKILVTGNTVVDAVRHLAQRIKPARQLDELKNVLGPEKRLALVTTHRRENWGAPMRNTCHAIKRLVAEHEDLQVVLPVHPNPMVKDVVTEVLKNVKRVHLIEPLPYEALIALERDADLILTDSGGLQEEAPEFGTPLLILRKTTERPEALTSGAAKLVGTCEQTILDEANYILKTAGTKVDRKNPFGDGHAAQRIAECLEHHLKSKL